MLCKITTDNCVSRVAQGRRGWLNEILWFNPSPLGATLYAHLFGCRGVDNFGILLIYI
jgi:hypothetical protein